MAQLVEHLFSKLNALGLISSTTKKLVVVVHTYNSSTQEIEAIFGNTASSRSAWATACLKKNKIKYSTHISYYALSIN